MSVSTHETAEIIDESVFEQAQDLTIELAKAEQALIEAARAYMETYTNARDVVFAVDDYTDSEANKDFIKTNPSINVLLEVFSSVASPNFTITDLAE